LKYFRKVDKASLDLFILPFYGPSSTITLANVPQQNNVLGDAIITVEANLLNYSN
jgi:hypothetical protein